MVKTSHLHQIWLAMSIHSEEKKFKCTYPRCDKRYKTKAEYSHHYNYRHKQKSAESQEIKCKMCDKMFSKVKYLKEHTKSHMDDLPFGYHLCGNTSNGGQAANYTLMKNTRRKVLVMNSKHFFFYLIVFWNLCTSRNFFLYTLLTFVCVCMPRNFSFTLC